GTRTTPGQSAPRKEGPPLTRFQIHPPVSALRHEGKHPSGQGMPGPLKEAKTRTVEAVLSGVQPTPQFHGQGRPAGRCLG
ncbi:hypothetical protein U0070_027506, partial [Myodes glareolus]